MLIPDLDLPHVTLDPGDDAALARAIEAGVYAQHLIDGGDTDPRLPEVVQLGRDAMEQLAWVGIRMALKYAIRTAHSAGLPAEELFQDGCVAVGEAIRRFDYARNFRFTTFVHEYLFRVMCDGGRHRLGHPQVSRADRRAARQALRRMEALGVAESPALLDTVAAAAGLSPTATRRGRIRMVPLDEVIHSPLLGYEPLTSHDMDFLALLLPRHRQVLQLRYGLTGPPRTLVQMAALLRASPSTVKRWEVEALDAARQLLRGERTTAAAAYREETAAAG